MLLLMVKINFIKGSAGKIIQDIINAGFYITDAEMFRIDTQNAQDFLEVYRGVLPDYHVRSSELNPS
jgi:nucleoside-diphosphate kinase